MLPLLALLVLQTPGPVLPVGAAPHLAELSLDVQRSLEAGNFPAAQALMKSWPVGKITYTAEGLPNAYAESSGLAATLVNEASSGRVSFEPAADGRVVFTFTALPPEGPKEPSFKDGKVYMDVPITDREGQPANARSVTWSIAKGLAFAAGLDSTTKRRSLMGHVIYVRSVADPTYSPREQSIFNRIEDARVELQAAIDGKKRLTPAIPNVTVTPDTVDFGTVTQGDREEFSITITNSGNAPALIEIETTCSCIIAQPALTLGPGESVTQKPRFDSTDYEGALDRHLYVLSNSPSNPRRTVVMRGTVVPEVRFMAPKGSKAVHSTVGDGLYEVEVAESGPSSLDVLFYGANSPIEVVDVQLGNRIATATSAPFNGQVDDPLVGPGIRSGSSVTVTIPENWPFGVSWLRVVAVTNSRRSPSVEMMLQIRKGIAASPQSMYFGDAKVGVEAERFVMVEHGSKPFKVTKFEATPGITATVEPADASGRRYKVVAKIRPTAAGPVSGAVTLTTDSPLQPSITIPVGGQAG